MANNFNIISIPDKNQDLGDRAKNAQILNNETKQYYNKAVQFYQLKKQSFLQKLNKNQEKQLTVEQLESLNERVEQAYSILSAAFNSIDKYIEGEVKNNTNLTPAQVFTNIMNKMESSQGRKEVIGNLSFTKKEFKRIGESAIELISSVFKNKTNREQFQQVTKTNSQRDVELTYDKIAGSFYETFIAAAMPYLGSLIDDKIDFELSNLLSLFKTTGNYVIQEETATKIGSKSISSDVASGRIQRNTKNSGGVNFYARSIVDVSPEEQKIFLDQKLDSSAQEWFDYYNYGREDLFGFSAKRWSGANNKEYTSSSKMQNALNKAYGTTKTGEPINDYIPTWNSKYAYAYMQRELGKNIIALLGPLNIGVFYGKNFEWMTDFIRTRSLYMHLYTRNIADNNEVFPHIASGSIYLYQEQKSNAIALAYTKANKDQEWFKIRVTGGLGLLE